jgi:Galactose oxidase, central domain
MDPATRFLASVELYDPSTGTFTATGAMTTPRQGHTATLLNTGKVLITGGESSRIPSVMESSAELYDPLTGTFIATGSMISPRTSHVAAMLPKGRVFIGGGGSCDAQPNPELYDPVSGQFALTGASSYPPELSAASASLLPNGNVLATLNVGCDVGSGAEVYDSARGTFTATANFIGGYNTATLLPEGTVLIAGLDFFPDGSAELYDPLTGAFTPVDGTFPKRESEHTATLLPDGSVLLAGGWICCGYSLSTAAVYHPAHPAPSPVLYSLPGGSQGAILHAGTHEVVSPANPAIQGEVLEVYGEGLINGGAIPPQVSIGGRLAEVLFFGRAPGYTGLDQINVRVPDGIAPGPALTVRLNYLSRPSNEVTMGVK